MIKTNQTGQCFDDAAPRAFGTAISLDLIQGG